MQYALPAIPRLCCLGLRITLKQPSLLHIAGRNALVTLCRPDPTGSGSLHSVSHTADRKYPAHETTKIISNGSRLCRNSIWSASDHPVNHSQRSNRRPTHTSAHWSTETNPNFGSLTEQEYSGHPSKFRDLPVQQLKKIFGPTISKSTGNNLLRTIQKQRVTGTLDEDIKEAEATPELVAQGLAWLRANYMLDEDAAIVKRIEAENQQIEQEFISDVQKYKNYVPQQSAAEDGIYGRSRFEELRKKNEAKAAAREKQAEEVRKAHGETAVASAQNRAVLTQRRESAEWVRRYKARAALSKMLEPPQMSLARRLLPSSVFAVVFLLLCFLFATNYSPPVKEARIFPDLPPAAATVLTLISMNVMFYFMWKLPWCWRFMNKNFLLIAATPYPPSLLGNIFSHQGSLHLLTNMAVIWLVGTRRMSPFAG